MHKGSQWRRIPADNGSKIGTGLQDRTGSLGGKYYIEVRVKNNLAEHLIGMRSNNLLFCCHLWQYIIG